MLPNRVQSHFLRVITFHTRMDGAVAWFCSHIARWCGGLCSAAVILSLAACTSAAPEGGPLASTVVFGEVGGSPGQFSYPRGIDHDGDALWIVDKGARVQRINAATGEGISGWRMPDWQMGRPTGITVWRPQGSTNDSTEVRIFVADTHYHRIMIYAPSGGLAKVDGADPGHDGMAWGDGYKFVGKLGTYGTGPGEFTYPTDVAVLASTDGRSIERLYVSEYGGTDRVSVFATGGTPDSYNFSFSIGRFGSGTGTEQVEFSRPQSLAIDQEFRELVVADGCNHRLIRLTLEGKIISYIGGPDSAGAGPGQMKYPYGITLLQDRTVIVAEYGNNRLQRFDLDTGASLGIFGEQGRGAGQLAVPWAVASLGGITYVLDSGNNRVQGILTPTGGKLTRAGVGLASSGGATGVEQIGGRH